jgi:hypothetical protein
MIPETALDDSRERRVRSADAAAGIGSSGRSLIQVTSEKGKPRRTVTLPGLLCVAQTDGGDRGARASLT